LLVKGTLTVPASSGSSPLAGCFSGQPPSEHLPVPYSRVKPVSAQKKGLIEAWTIAPSGWTLEANWAVISGSAGGGSQPGIEESGGGP